MCTESCIMRNCRRQSRRSWYISCPPSTGVLSWPLLRTFFHPLCQHLVLVMWLSRYFLLWPWSSSWRIWWQDGWPLCWPSAWARQSSWAMSRTLSWRPSSGPSSRCPSCQVSNPVCWLLCCSWWLSAGSLVHCTWGGVKGMVHLTQDMASDDDFGPPE